VYIAVVEGTNWIVLPADKYAEPPLSISEPSTETIAIGSLAGTAALISKFLPAEEPPNVSVADFLSKNKDLLQ